MAINLTEYLKHSWTHQKGVKGDIKLAILAAGLGRRMDPLTSHHLPKPMFPLGGSIPMSEMWVRRSIKSGISDISMNLCVLSQSIRNHFQDGSKFGADINYVEEDTPSGTLGGICKQALGKNAKQVLENETMPQIEEFNGTTIVAPSGDIVTDFDFNMLDTMYQIHKEKGAALTMVLSPIPWEKRKEFGTVILDKPEKRSGLISQSGRIANFREKDPDSPSNLNNASIYMIEMELLKAVDPFRTPADPEIDEPFYDFGKHVFPAMLGTLDYKKLPKDFVLWGLQYDGIWYDVGRKRDYLDVNNSLLNGDFKLEMPYEKYPWGFLGTGVTIDFSRITINPPVVIGNNCKIESGTTLGPYAVIGDGWTIEKNAAIKNSVLWKHYPYYKDNGTELPVDQREKVDAHRVCSGTIVDQSIVVGGTIKENLQEKIVDIKEDGNIEILSIDYVPKGKRA